MVADGVIASCMQSRFRPLNIVMNSCHISIEHYIIGHILLNFLPLFLGFVGHVHTSISTLNQF